MTSHILPHNIYRETPLAHMIIDVNDMIDSIQSEIDVAEYQVSMGEDPHIQVGEMRKMIDSMQSEIHFGRVKVGTRFQAGMTEEIHLHQLFLDYLWAKWSFYYSLEDIDDVRDRIDYFEERACSPLVQSDIEDNLQAAEELSQNLSVMIDRLALEQTCFLIRKKEYFYACIKEIDSVIKTLSIWGFCNLDTKNEKLALLNDIEFLEQQIQRNLT